MRKLLFAIFVFSLLVFSCDFPEFNNKIDTRKFWVRNFEKERYEQVNAELLASNYLCEVWAEKDSGVTRGLAQTVANEYANKIYPVMMENFGWVMTDDSQIYKYSDFKTMPSAINTMEYADYYGDQNGKLIILLVDIKDGYTPGGVYTGGYFNPADYYSNSRLPSNIRSNECDMIYIDTYPGLQADRIKSTYMTLAHELQHLMNYNTSYALDREYLTDTWVDEGLSVISEWLYLGYHPNIRWEWYNEDPTGYISRGNNFFMWGNHNEDPDSDMDDYSTVYLFFQWLRLHTDEDFLYNTFISEYDDYRAVTENKSVKENITAESWEELLGMWLAANFINDESGLYGYKNEADLKDIKAHFLDSTSKTFNLYSGEGVYSYVAEDSYEVPDKDGFINYKGLDAYGTVLHIPAYGALLTYNANTNNNPYTGSLNGAVTGIKPPEAIQPFTTGSRSAASEYFGSYPVDVGTSLRQEAQKENERNAF